MFLFALSFDILVIKEAKQRRRDKRRDTHSQSDKGTDQHRQTDAQTDKARHGEPASQTDKQTFRVVVIHFRLAHHTKHSPNYARQQTIWRRKKKLPGAYVLPQTTSVIGSRACKNTVGAALA